MQTLQRITQGIEQMKTLQFRSAEKSFQEALQSDSRSLEARIWLARLALLRKQNKEALQHVEKALQMQPDCADAIALKGMIRLIEKKDAEGVELLEKAKRIDPHLPTIEYNLAKGYRRLRKFDLAKTAARKAVEMEPQNFQAHGELAIACLHTRHTKEAIVHFAEAIRINPLFLNAYLALGRIYKRAGKIDQAIRLYRAGLGHNANAHVLRERLCVLYLMNKNAPAAYRQAVELAIRRNLFGDYLRLGSYALLIGAFDKAEAAFRKSVELNPTGWQGNYNLAELYTGFKQFTRAKEEYQRAIDKGSKSGKPYNGLGLLILNQGKDIEGAKKLFQKAMAVDPKLPEPVFNMAVVCTMMKEPTPARLFAEATLKLARPGSSVFRQAQMLIAPNPTN